MRSRRIGSTAALSAVLIVSATAVPGPATAAPVPAARVISTEVIAPANIAVYKNRVLIADSVESVVLRLRGSHTSVALTGTPGSDVAGVAFSRDGRTIAVAGNEFAVPIARGSLTIAGPGGANRTVDLSTHEESANPDGAQHYGVDHPSACVTEALSRFVGTSTDYDGRIDSRPASVVAGSDSSWLVADRGANDVVRVDRRGRVSTVAVLPRESVRITQALADAAGLPHCTVGIVYHFEAVPTDLEVGPDGALYVSTSGGALETLGLRAPGRIYRIAPGTGRLSPVVTGLVNAGNLAFDGHGRLFVVDGPGISVVRHGRAVPFIAQANIGALAAGFGGLLVGTLVQFDAEDNTGSVLYIRT